MKVDHIYVSDDTAIVDMTSTSFALNERPYAQRYCWITRFVDGLNEELFYTQMMTKPKLKVSRFLKSPFNSLGNA